MLFYKEESAMIFIDGDHTNTAARILNFTIDYKKLFEVFAGRMRLIRAYYYSINEPETLQHFNNPPDYHYSYAIEIKSPREFTDAAGRINRKTNINTELAIDVMYMCDGIAHIVIFAGDEDFCHLVDLLKLKHIRVSVVSTTCCSPPMIPPELRRRADNYIELADLIPHIQSAASTDAPPIEPPADAAPEQNF